MDENDMQRAINSLKKDLVIFESNKSSEILSIILIIVAFLGGGLIFGAIFKAVPLFLVMSIITSSLPLSTRFKELEDINLDVKNTRAQIAAYSDEIEKLKELRKSLERPIEKKKAVEKAKDKYEFKGRDTEKSKPKKSKDIPIEFFDESDFLDEEKDNGHKKR